MRSPIEIPATAATPLIRIDTGSGLFLMQGVCIPEDSPGFFGMVITQYTEALAHLNVPGVFRFELKYFNSSSLKGLFILMKRVEDLNDGRLDLRMEWVMDGIDDDMFEPVDLLSSATGIPLTVLPVA